VGAQPGTRIACGLGSIIRHGQVPNTDSDQMSLGYLRGLDLIEFIGSLIDKDARMDLMFTEDSLTQDPSK
jgi:hypothetical protein